MFDVIKSSATLLNPQFNSAFNQLLSDLLQVVLLGVSGFAAMAFKEWRANQKSAWKKAIADRLVKYAEQKLGDNAEKNQWVSDQLSSHFPRMSKEEVQHRVEEAVVDLKSQIDAPATTTNVAVVEPTPPATPAQ